MTTTGTTGTGPPAGSGIDPSTSNGVTDTGVGKSPVGRLAIVVLTALFAVAATLMIVAIVQLWPTIPAAGKPAPPQHHVLFWYHFTVSYDVGLILLAVLGGGLGGFVYVLRSIMWYAGNRTLRWSWVVQYVLFAPMCALLAAVFYFVYRAGLVATSDSTTTVSPYGTVAIAALVGLFSAQALEKLKEVFETLLTKAPTGRDHTPQTPPTITDLNPDHGPIGTTVTITGTGFIDVSEVAFKGTATASATPQAGGTDTKIIVTVPGGTETGPVVVTTPHGHATSPKNFTVET